MSISVKLITNRISFESHVVTVQDYLNWYKTCPEANREMGSNYFSEYLISACWRKMKRRIGHWAAVGFIYKFRMVDDWKIAGLLNSQSSFTKVRGRSDRQLSEFLRILATTDNLEKILENYKTVDFTEPKKDVLPHLLKQCRDSPDDIYNKETAIEFHHFLVATLLCYAKSLQDVFQPPQGEGMERKASDSNCLTPTLMAALNSCRILHRILSSAAFRHHINLLAPTFFLLPSESEIEEYRNFSEEHGLPWQLPARTRSDKPDVEDSNHCDGDLDPDDSAFEDIADDEDLERDQVPPIVTFNNVPDDTVLIVEGWVKLFVQHFHAKHILESFVLRGRMDIPIEIKVYGISPPRKHLFMPDWETLLKIINSSLETSSLNDEERNEVVDIFKRRLDVGMSSNGDGAADGSPMSVKGRNIFNAVGKIASVAEGKTKERRRMFYKSHCEVAFQALVAFSKMIAPGVAHPIFADKEVLDVLKVCL